MKTKNLFLLLPLLFLTQISFGQNHIIKGRALYIPGKPILYFNAGIGYEYLFNKNMSFSLVYNYSGSDMRDNDENAKFKQEGILEYRVYNNDIKPISKSVFGFAFISYFNEQNKQSGEIGFFGQRTLAKITTTEKAIGGGVGKNFKLSKRFHLEVFAGPKLILQNEEFKYSDNTSTSISTTSSSSLKFGVRGGINLAYQF